MQECWQVQDDLRQMCWGWLAIGWLTEYLSSSTSKSGLTHMGMTAI